MAKTIKTEHVRRVTVLYPSASIDEEAAKDKKKLRVAAYCRVSTDLEEQQASFAAQKDFYERTLSANPDYSFVGIYADEGVSGTGIKKREGFLRMLEDSRSRKLDMVITKSVSRFGRNTVDCLNAIRELKSLGIDVFFEKENIHTMRSEGELLLTLMMAVAEAESVSISENVKWGMRKRVERGSTSVLSARPYGYDKGSDGLVINEPEALVVRRIFQDSWMDTATRILPGILWMMASLPIPTIETGSTLSLSRSFRMRSIKATFAIKNLTLPTRFLKRKRQTRVNFSAIT